MNFKNSIAIIKERREAEDRVLLFPREVTQLTEAGYEVWIEADAGLGAGVSNEAYQAAGARIVDTATAWCNSPLVVKLKAPQPQEYQYFHDQLHLCAFFHLEDNRSLAEHLCRKGVTAYSYEFLRTDADIFPISIPQSEISGKLAVLYGAYHLQRHMGGSGILLADTIGVPKPKVVIIGYGNVGGAAIKTAVALGLEVVVIGTDPEKLRKFRRVLPSEVTCYLNTREVIQREVVDADLVIGAILISTYDTPPVIDEETVMKMKTGSMIIDVTCGYGDGFLPTCHQFSTHEYPTYTRHGVLHCKIDSLPASVPVTASQALSFQITPYLMRIGNCVYDQHHHDEAVDSCKVTQDGQVVSDIVKDNFTLMAQMDTPITEDAVSGLDHSVCLSEK